MAGTDGGPEKCQDIRGYSEIPWHIQNERESAFSRLPGRFLADPIYPKSKKGKIAKHIAVIVAPNLNLKFEGRSTKGNIYFYIYSGSSSILLFFYSLLFFKFFFELLFNIYRWVVKNFKVSADLSSGGQQVLPLG